MSVKTTTKLGSGVPPDSSDEVLGLLRRQATLYGKLESMAARQRTLVTGNDVGSLLSLLADRSKVSRDLSDVGERLAPVRSRWARFREGLSDADRREADGLVATAGAALRRMIAGDEQDVRILSGRKESVAQALKGAHLTARAIDAYQTCGARPGSLDCTEGGA